MSGVTLKKYLKRTLIGLILFVLSWSVLYLYLSNSPRVALNSCIDNSGVWIEDQQKCYCDPEHMNSGCDASIDDYQPAANP